MKRRRRRPQQSREVVRKGLLQLAEELAHAHFAHPDAPLSPLAWPIWVREQERELRETRRFLRQYPALLAIYDQAVRGF